ncbi:MAG: tRNA (N(6)-L-threonylcarbamoyladenosine(37)-C(2))-methylthiotransferase MtaB [Candidatus Latescibacteria bacterium]|nr:tRNA (N(6)-L-threonylcarbamoyladenosine(37)-C(2))-methylthiotransferase MtaB [Candidatus Latescibacterota bacterium]
MSEEHVKKVAFYTLGCKMNTYDTQWYGEQFAQQGYQEVPFGEPADVTVVNTCTVTGQGDAQSRNALRRAHRTSPEGTVVAVGCYAQTDPDTLSEMPEVDLVVGNAEKTQLMDLLNDTCSMGRTFVTRSRATDFEDMDIYNFGGRSRAFVKVQEGCNEFCSFCIIPFARGRSRSRTVDSTVAQVQKLVDAGYGEVVLTGVHIGDYGVDLDGTQLLDILEAIEQVDGLLRFRVSSIEATFVTDAMIDFFETSEKFCRHLHVPLQSGDDGVLKAMRRPYMRAQYIELIEKLASRIPDIGIGGDVMVGFPGESDAAFQNTYDLIASHPMTYLHVFPYSPRGKTPAARMPDQVDAQVKKQRGATLRALGAEKVAAFQDRFIGQTLPVLFESRRRDGLLSGLTDNYIRVIAPGADVACDKVLDVQLDRIQEGVVLGNIVADGFQQTEKHTLDLLQVE